MICVVVIFISFTIHTFVHAFRIFNVGGLRVRILSASGTDENLESRKLNIFYSEVCVVWKK